MRRLICPMLCLLLLARAIPASDWPVYGGDNKRSARSADVLKFPLHPAWVHQSAQPPRPGFKWVEHLVRRDPADYAETMTFDYAFAPVVAGGFLYFGSSAEDSIACLRADNGQLAWRYFTEGPVRLAPAIDSGRVYAGSDDGCVYCLDAATGKLVWRFCAAPTDHKTIANGRLTSIAPVRTGVTLADGTAYFAAGLFPTSGGVMLYALNAASGELLWKQQLAVPAQGYILATEDRLVIPTGRSAPVEYWRKDGSPVYELPFPYLEGRREGGGAVVQMLGGMVAYGPNEYKVIRVRVSGDELENRGQSRLWKISGSLAGIVGRRILADDQTVYLLRDDTIRAFEKKGFTSALKASEPRFIKRPGERAASFNQLPNKSGVQMGDDKQMLQELEACRQWQAPNETGFVSLAMSDGILLAGGRNLVAGYDKTSSRQLWSARIDGTACELAVAAGRLYASTDTGRIYCFSSLDATVAAPAISRTGTPEAMTESMRMLARAVAENAATTKGFCLVLGMDTSLLEALARASEWTVAAPERDEAKINAAREALYARGLYGSRVVLHRMETGRLPYPDYFANLIVIDETLAGGWETLPSFSEILRVLRPCGGTLLVKTSKNSRALHDWSGDAVSAWQATQGLPSCFMARRPVLPGSGEWTHLYANPANTSCSGDQLAAGTAFEIQWFGPPGPEKGADRHSDAMGPLYKDGHLFVPGWDSIQAVDAYNGTPLWEREIPGFTRMGVGYESGAACIDERFLYAAAGESCWVIDATAGTNVKEYAGPRTGADWGYVAVAEGLLLGSNQHPKATWHDEKDPEGKLKGTWKTFYPPSAISRPIVSDCLFALDKDQGRRRWLHEGAGVVLNSSITVGDGRVFFAESRNPAARGHEKGRVALPEFLKSDAWLVALELQSGRTLWEQPLDLKSERAFYLCYARGTLLAMDTYYRPAENTAKKRALRKIQYGLYAFDPATGAEKWRASFPGAAEGFDHNYNLMPPVIAGDKAYLSAANVAGVNAFDLATGRMETIPEARGGKFCGLTTASNQNLFYRKGATMSYHLPAAREIPVSTVSRPGCWISLLPAGGLILMPEATAGCNCAFPLQTSIVLRPATP